MYDLIIIGGGASGLFCSINTSKNSKKLIIEKQENLGQKILLSGGGRCNFTNLNIDPDKYFGQNKKMLASIFHKYSNYDFMNYLDENGINYNIEDNGRVILKSGKAKELLDFLIQESKNNNTEIQTGITITKIEKIDEGFKITSNEKEFICKNLVIATGGISYPQIGTTGFGIQIAKDFGLNIIPSFPSLCGLETDIDFSSLTGSSISGTVELFDGNKKIYENQGNILFTHRGLSGPAIFNCSAGLAEYLTKKLLENKMSSGALAKNIAPLIKGEREVLDYSLISQGNIQLKITPNEITKKLEKFISSMSSGVLTKDIAPLIKGGRGDLDSSLRSEGQGITTQITNFRPLEEAKVSSGGVDITEIKPNFECRNIPNLYFIGETLDIIGETGGFNLQRARSSGFVCGQNF